MLSNKKGVAMVLVIGLVLMLLILGGAVLMVSMGHFGTSYHQIKRARAYYAAEAGMQHALWKCRTGGYNLGTGDSDTITVQDPNYTLLVTITIDPPGVEGINPIKCEVTY